MIGFLESRGQVAEISADGDEAIGFTLRVDPGKATGGQVADVLIALSRLMRGLNATEIEFRISSYTTPGGGRRS